MPKSYRVCSKSYRKPKRPFEKERLDSEMQLIGKYGLKNKREVWRVMYILAKWRSAARHLLTLEEKDQTRLFQGDAMIRRLKRYGLLEDGEDKLDYVLGLTASKLLERRLQTLVFKDKLAKTIHHARVIIRQRHIRVGKQLVNIPSFMVRKESAGFLDFTIHSPFGNGRPGRVARKKLRSQAAKDDEE
eukprot:GHVP01024703.1.p1 GENE.GHVP01024703.1~~GHVP01024703.1.p1  ORF type:complete len:188 (+),score=20.32 GHVP01024703.1:127-690(+)